MTVDTLAVAVLAQDPTGPEFGKASPFGLALVVVLLIATALLIWNMNKRLGKLPETFEPENPEPDQLVDDGTLPGVVQAGDAASPSTTTGATAVELGKTESPADPDRTPPTASN
ncbi:hypothetical protein TVH25_09260 [Rhodococcus sp. 7Tela_A2]|jgi:hypothetical protein|uniref:hypothetical protein n=1 Tax=unclassified Rhodococcus (in: high G+C Gram-positive bacteria) TaxID=192944 RepID=UPI001F107A6F|nr:hypothetical protein [Rhodococcus sp. BL-253-APC-6A1W]